MNQAGVNRAGVDRAGVNRVGGHSLSTRRIRAHAGWELRLILRNGEQALLAFGIPVALLVGLRAAGGIDAAAPTVLAVSVLATCFTSLAIATGFERRSGALAFLGATPLTRLDLLLGKLLATLALTMLSTLVTSGAALALGWRPQASYLGAVLVVVVGGAACCAWAVSLAGALRAEAVLAVANGLFVLLVAFGGVVFPAERMPEPLSTVVGVLPSAALADGLRAALADGVLPWVPVGVLLLWLVAGMLVARRSFRWDS